MWTKDIYQEQMLGYLDEVEADIEQLAHAQLEQHDLTTLYIDLDITSKRLWRLIGSSYEEWEECRYSLEASCDALLRTFYSLPPTDAVTFSAFAVTEHGERSVEHWKAAEMAWQRADMPVSAEIRTNPDDRLDNKYYRESNVSSDFARTLIRKE